MSRASLINDEDKFIITINYKCASKESIEWFIENLKDYQHENLTLGGKLNKKYVMFYQKKKLRDFKDYYKITIVRNPYHRAVSCFLDRGLRKYKPLVDLCKRRNINIFIPPAYSLWSLKKCCTF